MKNKKSLLKLASKVTAVVVIALAFFFFYRTLSANWDKVKDYDIDFNWYIIPAILIMDVAVMVSGILWNRILKKLTGKKLPELFAIKVHVYGWLLKYLPGQAGLVIGKLVMVEPRGFRKKDILVSIIYENIFLVLVSFLVGLPGVLLVFGGGTMQKNSLIIYAAVVLFCVVLLAPPVFYRAVNTGLKLIKKEILSKEYFLQTRELIEFILLYTIPRIINGIGFVFLIATFVDIVPSMYVGIGLTYVISSIIGMIAFAVPGGVGVREGVMTLLLSHYFPLEIAIMLSLLARLVVTVGDGTLFLFNLSLRKK